jgi:hypothetical protein
MLQSRPVEVYLDYLLVHSTLATLVLASNLIYGTPYIPADSHRELLGFPFNTYSLVCAKDI